MSSREKIHVVFAAAELQPHVGEVNAYNWLADLRRATPVYDSMNKRISSSPEVIKDRGQLYYYKADIERMVDEVIRSK